jgi:hypothetical protein
VPTDSRNRAIDCPEQSSGAGGLRSFDLCPSHCVSTAATSACSCPVAIVFEKMEAVDAAGSAFVICWQRPKLESKGRRRRWYSCDTKCVEGNACKMRLVANRLSKVTDHRLRSLAKVKLPAATPDLLRKKRTLDNLDPARPRTIKLPSGRDIGRIVDTDAYHARTRWFCVGSCGSSSCDYRDDGYLDYELVAAHVDGADAKQAASEKPTGGVAQPLARTRRALADITNVQLSSSAAASVPVTPPVRKAAPPRTSVTSVSRYSQPSSMDTRSDVAACCQILTPNSESATLLVTQHP